MIRQQPPKEVTEPRREQQIQNPRFFYDEKFNVEEEEERQIKKSEEKKHAVRVIFCDNCIGKTARTRSQKKRSFEAIGLGQNKTQHYGAGTDKNRRSSLLNLRRRMTLKCFS